MTNVNIELPDTLHTKLKLKAVAEGKTIQQVFSEIMRKKVKV